MANTFNEIIKFSPKLSISDMKKLVFKPNISSQEQLVILYYLAQYQDFSNPTVVNEIFRSTQPLVVFSAPTLSIEKMVESDSDGFWKQLFSIHKIIRERYIDETLIAKYPDVFNVKDAIINRPFSESIIYSTYNNFQFIPDDTLFKIVRNQTLSRSLRDQIKIRVRPKSMLVLFQNVDEDEIISICLPKMTEIRRSAKEYAGDNMELYYNFWKSAFFDEDISRELLDLLYHQKISQTVLRALGRELAFSTDIMYKFNNESELISIIEFVRGSTIHPYQTYPMYSDVNWDSISIIPNLSEDFMSRFRNHLNWRILSNHQKFSTNFINRYSRHIFFGILFLFNKFLTEDIVVKFLKRCYIKDLQENKHFDKILFKKIISEHDFDSFREFGPSRPIKQFGRLREECKYSLDSRHFHPLDTTEIDASFDMDTLKTILNFELFEMLFYDNVIGLCNKLKDFYPNQTMQMWEYIWKWCTCSEDFIEFAIRTYGENVINWRLVAQYQKLSLSFVKRHANDIDLGTWLISQSISPSELDNILKTYPNLLKSVFDKNQFFFIQYFSQNLIDTIVTMNPEYCEIILKTQKIYSLDLIQKIIINSTTSPIINIIYKYQQPFSNNDFAILEFLQFDEKAINIFPKTMAVQLCENNFVPDRFKIMFKIINDIFDGNYINNESELFVDVLSNSNLHFFHSFITNEMIENDPMLFFGQGLAPIPIYKQFSHSFIKKWFKFMSPKHLLETQSLDIELIELLLNTCKWYQWGLFFNNNKISDEIKLHIATKYYKQLPINLRG